MERATARTPRGGAAQGRSRPGGEYDATFTPDAYARRPIVTPKITPDRTIGTPDARRPRATLSGTCGTIGITPDRTIGTSSGTIGIACGTPRRTPNRIAQRPRPGRLSAYGGRRRLMLLFRQQLI